MLFSKEQNLIIVDDITAEVAGKKKHYELELKWIDDCVCIYVKQEEKKEEINATLRSFL